jgi:hypothetical protein
MAQLLDELRTCGDAVIAKPFDPDALHAVAERLVPAGYDRASPWARGEPAGRPLGPTTTLPGPGERSADGAWPRPVSLARQPPAVGPARRPWSGRLCQRYTGHPHGSCPEGW